MCPHFSKASLGVKSGGGKHNSMMNSECGEKTTKTLCLSSSRGKEMSMVDDQCWSDNSHVHVWCSNWLSCLLHLLPNRERGWYGCYIVYGTREIISWCIVTQHLIQMYIYMCSSYCLIERLKYMYHLLPNVPIVGFFSFYISFNYKECLKEFSS